MRSAALILLSTALSACAAFEGAGDGRQAAAPTATDALPTDVADGLAIYLQTLRSLIEGDRRQADVFRNVAAAAEAAPTTTNRLMLKLARNADAPSSDEAKAQALLSGCSPRAIRCCPRSACSRCLL
jgi:hypothetical protein